MTCSSKREWVISSVMVVKQLYKERDWADLTCVSRSSIAAKLFQARTSQWHRFPSCYEASQKEKSTACSSNVVKLRQIKEARRALILPFSFFH